MKKTLRFERWLGGDPLSEPGPADQPAIHPDSLKKHFNESQIEFIQKRIALDCPDLRSMTPEQLGEFFSRDGGINDAKIIMTFLVQYYVRFLEEQDGSIRGNLKSFWYRKLARSLERLGRLDARGGISVKSAGSRSRYLLKTMEDSFEQLFLQEFFHYRDLDVYNHRESFRLMGRDKKRHLFYTEKEGLFWFCETVHARHSCHAFASRGSATWLDIDYLAEAIRKLDVRNLYVAALTDYDPWGLFLALGREGIFTDGSWKYYLSDGLGSTVALVDEDGNSIAEWDYGDYGETEQIAGDPGLYNPYLFTGQEWDSELGMYNLRARHYSPSLGRFLARDSIGYSGGSNLYAYCNGDPVNFIDPSGTLVKFSSGGQNLESFSPGFTTKWNEAVSLAQEKFALYGYSVFKGYQVIYKGDIPGQFTGLRDSQYQSDIKYEDYLTGGWDVTFTFKCGEGFASDMSGQAEAIDSHNVYIFDLALSTSAKGLANLILHELTHVGLMRKHQRSDYWNLPEFGGIGHPAKYFGQGIDAIPDGAW